MNTKWSDCVQNIGTLYLSRQLRFADRYKDKYVKAFGIRGGKIRILEIGCGPGALTQALARWYPEAEVIGLDYDSNFVAFAKEQASDIKFIEGDATDLPFDDGYFDVVISNTVQEHIEPSRFFGEQLRVLKQNGVCLVLSARRGINLTADCIAEESEFEKGIWAKVERFQNDTMAELNVGKYAMSERELPLTMQKYGFCNVSTEYLVSDFTIDNPDTDRELAYAIINEQRQTDIDGVNSLRHTARGVISEEELFTMQELINKKYDKRIALYDSYQKQWDTNVLLTMVLRGVK